MGVLDPSLELKGLVVCPTSGGCYALDSPAPRPKSAWFERRAFTCWPRSTTVQPRSKCENPRSLTKRRHWKLEQPQSQTIQRIDGVFPAGEFSIPLGKFRGAKSHIH